jgi:hypothetical protein
MWLCPKCNESIEDQFDSCWKCAGAVQAPPPMQDLAWMYPLISLVAWAGLGSLHSAFEHWSHREGGYCDLVGAVIGLVVSAICIWTFLSCPWRHLFAKIVTLLFLIPVLMYGVFAVSSFVIHIRH